MSYDAIMHKLSSAELTLSPQMQDVIQRVRETGLHKVAAPLYGVDEVTLKTAVQQLSTAWLAQHYKYQKIASGLDSYAIVNGEKTAGPRDIWNAVQSRFLGKAPAAAEATGAAHLPGLADTLAPTGRGIGIGKPVNSFGTGGLAAPMSQEQQLGHQYAGMVRDVAPRLEAGNAIANKMRTSAIPPEMPPAMAQARQAGQATAKMLTPVSQFSGSKRILPAKPGQLA